MYLRSLELRRSGGGQRPKAKRTGETCSKGEPMELAVTRGNLTLLQLFARHARASTERIIMAMRRSSICVREGDGERGGGQQAVKRRGGAGQGPAAGRRGAGVCGAGVELAHQAARGAQIDEQKVRARARFVNSSRPPNLGGDKARFG